MRNQKLSLWDAIFYSLMMGVGETYLPAWALSIGMSEVQAGLFAILPLLMGSLMQIFSPWVLARVGSVKKWVLITTAIQALSFLPLFYFSLYPTQIFPILFFIVSVYWGAGLAAVSCWNYWMSFLVDGKHSADFFSKRARYAQIGVLCGIVMGGLLLHAKVSLGWITTSFTILFLLAFFFRSFSFFFLFMKDYSHDWNLQHPATSIPQAFKLLWKRKHYRLFFGFLFSFFMVIAISSPFVAPYLLEKLRLSYAEFMMASASLFVAKIIASPFAAKWVKIWGVKRVLLIGAFGISPLPMLWFLNDSLLFVSALQFVSGFFWALLEVSLLIVFFGELSHDEKIPILTIYNLFYALAWISGTWIGGKWLSLHLESLESYYQIFIGGSFLRMAVVVIFILMARSSKKELLPKW